MTGNAASKIPWIIWVYLALLALFSVLLALSALFEMITITSDFGADRLTILKEQAQAFSRLAVAAGDGIKVTLGALIGALSMAARETFGAKPS